MFDALQVAPQLIPPGDDVTRPEPGPLFVTVRPKRSTRKPTRYKKVLFTP
jgi:hypothetical protein